MKRILLILCVLLTAGLYTFAQQENANEGNEKIRDKMNEYIQKKLNLSRSEAEKFSPVFLRYFKEWRMALQETKGEPILLRQQKVVDLRLRYMYEFKNIIGEQRSAEVFDQQEGFIREMRKLRQERLQGAGDRIKRFNTPGQ
jgi:hypothetical protein